MTGIASKMAPGQDVDAATTDTFTVAAVAADDSSALRPVEEIDTFAVV
jgi:hypothetical protein